MSSLRAPATCDKVYKEECMYCFHNPLTPGGLFVCLNNYYGYCDRHIGLGVRKNPSFIHFAHCIRIRHKRADLPAVEPDEKVTKLAIGVDGGFQADLNKYDYEDTWTYAMYPGLRDRVLTDPQLPASIRQICDGIVAAESAFRLQELESLAGTWDGSLRIQTKHADVPQLPNPPKIPPKGWVCQHEGCSLTDNLWLNLTDGKILCGRRFWDGTGGNSHAVDYYHQTKYPLAVKLGTITAHGADVYSYEEDDMVDDPNLAQHLQHFGINMKHMEKTEKTMLELELDLNQRYEWSTLQEEGSRLQPVYGPGYTGMINLGSSCYINASMQTLCLLDEFVSTFVDKSSALYETTTANPTEQLSVQLAKLFCALQSGDYSQPPPAGPAAAPEVPPGNGIKPLAFRTLIGRGHPEFSTKRQQDAEEFLRYLFDQLERTDKALATRPLQSLRFEVVERTQCQTSKKVVYQRRPEVILGLPIHLDAATNAADVAKFKERQKQLPQGQRIPPEEIVRPKIPLMACLERFAAEQSVGDFYSEAAEIRTTAARSLRLGSFPDYLLVQIQKFGVNEDWTPHKLDIELELPPGDVIDLSHFRSTGPQPGEELMDPPSITTSSPGLPQIDESLVSQLQEMGFAKEGCRKAVYLTRSSGGLEAATEWIMEHMGDPDFDQPHPDLVASVGGAPAGGDEVDPNSLQHLQALGFTALQATKALKECNNDVNAAAEWLFEHPDETGADLVMMETSDSSHSTEESYRDGSERYRLVGFISHMGSSTSCGHYVCHLKKNDQWVIFNDEKVALSEKPPKGLGYIYLFQRLPS